MFRHNELRETEDCFFDATPYASDNEWSIDALPRADETAPALSAVLSAEARRAKAEALAKADATPYASENEWNVETPQRTDDSASDARPCREQGRILVIGFHVIRL